MWGRDLFFFLVANPGAVFGILQDGKIGKFGAAPLWVEYVLFGHKRQLSKRKWFELILTLS